jgi:uncharacterized protein YidB (DUF937 family)
MAMFDEIISLADQRFGLRDKAGSLMSLLLSSIVDPKTGGLGGFLDRLRKSGLNTVADRMLGGSDTTPLTKDQLEQALGGDHALHHLASKVGLSESAVASAAGFLLPRMVGLLTPAGRVPDHLSGEIQEFIRAHEVGKVGAERRHEPAVATVTARPDYESERRETHETGAPRDVAVEARDVVGEVQRREVYAAPRRETYEAQHRETYEAPRREAYEGQRREAYEGQRREAYEAPRRETYEAPRRDLVHEAPRRQVEVTREHEDSGWFWWALPLVALGLLGAYAIKACAPARETGFYGPTVGRREVIRPAQPVPGRVDRYEAAPETVPAPPAVAPRLAIERLDNGRVRVSGVVVDDPTRRAVLTALETAFGSGNVTADITVDPRAESANWLGRLQDIAKAVAANPNAAITLEGNNVNMGGSITDADRRSLIDTIRGYLGRDFTIH